ncbi:hypothetical protein EJD97_002293 [Solanum chilense]|uniref:Knottins-like domain-containing protein n=1 Tax=Solanum chilense TaxID=4083 RepID=A0A6N2ALV9_SOLCI|nr:hypothetical protein EJD97_002293 [Solanum chilense]
MKHIKKKSSKIVMHINYKVEKMGPMRIVEARHCESLSHRFKGPCVSDKNCASVCETERFSGGNCRGFRRRCFCTKPC